MRIVSVVALVVAAACGGDDQTAPALVGAVALPADALAVADPTDPLAVPPPVTGTLPIVDLLFSERLDGDAVEEVLLAEDTSTVLQLVGRDGVVRIAPIDGSVVGETVEYLPARRAIRVRPAAHLPADTIVLLHLMADRVWDPDGNVVPAAHFPDGEPVRDIDGRPIAATVSLATEPIRIAGATIPTYGTLDDATGETIPYDAAVTLTLNTAVAPSSVVASITSASAAPVALAASNGDRDDEILLTPLTALEAGTAYELRVEAMKDRFGVAWTSGPRHFPFATD